MELQNESLIAGMYLTTNTLIMSKSKDFKKAVSGHYLTFFCRFSGSLVLFTARWLGDGLPSSGTTEYGTWLPDWIELGNKGPQVAKVPPGSQYLCTFGLLDMVLLLARRN